MHTLANNGKCKYKVHLCYFVNLNKNEISLKFYLGIPMYQYIIILFYSTVCLCGALHEYSVYIMYKVCILRYALCSSFLLYMLQL